MQGPGLLTPEYVLLTTLLAKIAVMATLATMLVRYRRFRHILIIERRAWPDRLVFALSFGIDGTATFWQLFVSAAWVAWGINLTVAEAWLHGRTTARLASA